MYGTAFVGSVLAFCVAWLAATWLQGAGRQRVALLDRPNERSLHVAPVPRTGGIAIAAAFLPAVAFLLLTGNDGLRGLLAGWFLVFTVSLLDDIYTLPFWVRLPVHLLAALCVTLAPMQEPLMLAVGVFWVVWGTNLFNFMDGMDGLAASMAVIGGGALALAFLQGGASAPALLLFVAVAAAMAFLWFNFPPARIFMGDAGAAPLGFLFAAAGLSGVASGQLPGWLPLLVFLPFIADATFTLLRRAWQRKPVWRAHREHAYQVLVLCGWPVRRVLAAYGLLMLLCSGLALLLPRSGSPGWLSLLGTVCLFAIVYWVIISWHDQRDFR